MCVLNPHRDSNNCVCVCVRVCVLVFMIYEDTNLYNDMGITLVLRRKHEI